jgi:hypothetical protein
MTALIQAFSRLSATTSNIDPTAKLLMIFSLTGLVVSLVCATYAGIDLTPGFVGP